MTLQSALFGTLSFSVFPHDVVALGGVAFMLTLALVLLTVITKRGLWRYLWREWFTSLDAKKIGLMYIAVSVVMLVRGLADAILMRLQQALSVGESVGILDPEHFQQIFSAHGTIMIFFVAMGLMFGIINLIVPLQIGTRDVAFPFLNSVSFWLFAFGAALVNVSLVLGDFSAAGWLSYPPLSGIELSPSSGVDYWIWSLQIGGLGSLLSGINFLTTIVTMRAKGMTYMRMPMFVWTVLGAMALVVFAFPILTVTLALLSLDRTLGMHFFTAAAGGNMMMYVNLIWAWGHPEVYILILPAFGIFSEIVPVFSGKKLAGYASMVFSVIAIVFLSFTVWLHHFFTMGAGANVNAVFGIMTAVIAIPTGVKIFNWLFTMYRGRIRLTTAMQWFMGFVVLFTIGGVTGVLLSVPPADYQLHNSLFLVAHFHNMIVSGVLFGYFAGLTFWFPKFFGFRLSERIGSWAVWSWIVGFVLAFTPLYILGFMGATRRLDHYEAGLGWQGLFIVAGIGVLIIAVGAILQVVQLVVSVRDRRHTRETTGDPWDGRSLEWSTKSPPPSYNFASLPIVHARDQFWALKEGGVKPEQNIEDIRMPKNTGLGFGIAACAFFFGFGVIWHIVWMIVLSILAVIVLLTHRAFQEDDDTEYVLRAEDIRRMESL
ncbi:MAG: cbb3-type cytochrome c oxidase subunit I [Candidatus Pacebacteria bacterium]|nr:cbb3-type cytochrome c oxidase subunit I [Candidatus Paceibacterota bacterium]